jgi:hypothetical protein
MIEAQEQSTFLCVIQEMLSYLFFITLCIQSNNLDSKNIQTSLKHTRFKYYKETLKCLKS